MKNYTITITIKVATNDEGNGLWIRRKSLYKEEYTQIAKENEFTTIGAGNPVKVVKAYIEGFKEGLLAK